MDDLPSLEGKSALLGETRHRVYLRGEPFPTEVCAMERIGLWSTHVSLQLEGKRP